MGDWWPVPSNCQVPTSHLATSKYLDIVPQEQKLLVGGPPTASRSGLLLLRSNDLFLIAGILSLAVQDQTVSALEACLAPQRSTRRLQKLKSVFSCLKLRQWEVATFEHRKANTPYAEDSSVNGILMCKSTSNYHLTWTSWDTLEMPVNACWCLEDLICQSELLTLEPDDRGLPISTGYHTFLATFMPLDFHLCYKRTARIRRCCGVNGGRTASWKRAA